MLESHEVEELLCIVSGLNRAAVIEQFQTYQSNFPVDFTPEFLNTLSDERLKHIFVALCLQCKRLPELGGMAPTALEARTLAATA